MLKASTADLPLTSAYHLRGFEPEDLYTLRRIEANATRQLAEAGYPSLLDDVVGEEAFEAQFMGKGVWIAADKSDKPVGYAIAGELAYLFWLHQISVDPSHGGRGIGGALLKAVINHAKWAFHNAVGLTTFRDVAFNAPLFEKAGFLQVNPATAPAPLQAQLMNECPDNIPVSARVLMVRKL